MKNSTTYSTYIRRRIAVSTIATIALVSGTYLLGQFIDTEYDYSCPTMLVTAIDGDTLSGITKKHCKGHTLQASWDIANERGTAHLDTGDIIQLGDK
jgi:hypothetical protein